MTQGNSPRRPRAQPDAAGDGHALRRQAHRRQPGRRDRRHRQAARRRRVRRHRRVDPAGHAATRSHVPGHDRRGGARLHPARRRQGRRHQDGPPRGRRAAPAHRQGLRRADQQHQPRRRHGNAGADEANPRNANKHGHDPRARPRTAATTPRETLHLVAVPRLRRPGGPGDLLRRLTTRPRSRPISCPDNVAFDAARQPVDLHRRQRAGHATTACSPSPIDGPRARSAQAVPDRADRRRDLRARSSTTSAPSSSPCSTRARLDGATVEKPASTWPDGDFARPAVVAVWRATAATSASEPQTAILTECRGRPPSRRAPSAVHPPLGSVGIRRAGSQPGDPVLPGWSRPEGMRIRSGPCRVGGFRRARGPRRDGVCGWCRPGRVGTTRPGALAPAVGPVGGAHPCAGFAGDRQGVRPGHPDRRGFRPVMPGWFRACGDAVWGSGAEGGPVLRMSSVLSRGFGPWLTRYAPCRVRFPV